jgi:hypothetical protein
MNGNFQNKNNKGRFKKVYLIVGVVVLLGMCFSISYLITDWITNPKDNTSIEEKTVYNSTDLLDDTVKISIINENNIDKEQTIKEFKEENNIEVGVNQQFVIDFLEDSGYTLETINNNKITFKKENKDNMFIANKYYLGEKDGYFAIYKTDDTGKLYIESESDVFTDYKKVNTIPIAAEEEIKTFKHYYDTKEEALERLAGYMN